MGIVAERVPCLAFFQVESKHHLLGMQEVQKDWPISPSINFCKYKDFKSLDANKS